MFILPHDWEGQSANGGVESQGKPFESLKTPGYGRFLHIHREFMSLLGNHDFDTNIKSPTASIAIDFDVNREVLLICFGGLAGKLGFPMFEFNALTSQLGTVNKIYLRDGHKLWYHRGIPDIGDDIASIVLFLQQYTLHPSTRRVVLFGNSAGAYAALLFGYLLQADEVHAFSPKTVIDPIKRMMAQDFPPRQPIRGLWTLFWRGQRKFFDLQDLFLKSSHAPRNFHIYYADNHKFDRYHGVRMKDVAGISLHTYNFTGHNLIKSLRQSGELIEIIEKALYRG